MDDCLPKIFYELCNYSCILNNLKAKLSNSLLKFKLMRNYASLIYVLLMSFLHDRPWISPWIKSISSELDIIIHVIALQLSGYCDVINNLLWLHQQNVNLAREARSRCLKIVVLSSFLSSLCRVRNRIMYVLSWRTVSALTRVFFWCLFTTINTKITLSWALKQFVTRVHTIFFIRPMLHPVVHCVWTSSSLYTYRITTWCYTHQKIYDKGSCQPKPLLYQR